MTVSPEIELKQMQASLARHKKFAESVRTAPLEFLSLETIAKTRCACCGNKPSHVSSYPFFDSADFARQIIVWCKACGFGMVPEVSFPLQRYYEEQYAVENRGDREIPPEIYFTRQPGEDGLPITLKRYFGRATDQLARIRKHMPTLDAMLDVGSGPGYALHLSEARVKDAIEYDRNSKKYLDYLGANLITWDTIPTEKYDAVLMSHVLEHFLPADVEPRLRALFGALKPGGLLYIEVPPGGMGWKHYNYKHEPHTLFFTPQALGTLCKRMQFEIVLLAPVAKTMEKVEERTNAIYQPNKKAFSDPRGRLTVICRKPGGEPASSAAET